jgi:hypothetical protein
VVTQPGCGHWTQSTNNVRPDESGWMLDGVLRVNFYDARVSYLVGKHTSKFGGQVAHIWVTSASKHCKTNNNK